MQSRTPSPNTHSGVSAKSKAVIYVLSKPFFFLRACFIQAAAIENTHTDSQPWDNHAEIGFGNYFRALGVLESRDPGANAGAFVGNMPIPPRAPGAAALHGAFHTTGTRKVTL